MREVDFLYLRSALKSLNSSTDLVLVRRGVQVTLSHQNSPYVSHRELRFELVPPPTGDDVLLLVNGRKVLVVGRTEDAVRQATETIGRDGRPFGDSRFGWDGPWADWVVEAVSSTLPLLHGILRCAHNYGLVEDDWLGMPLLYAGWLVPVVMGWDEIGKPIFSWPDEDESPAPAVEEVAVDA